MQSTDQGKSWSNFVTIEPYSNSTTAQVSSYGMCTVNFQRIHDCISFKVCLGSVTARPDGSRVFALWVQNVNNISHLPGAAPSKSFRADMLGEFVWKYSDDQGRSWSARHYPIPVPETYIDRINSWNGSVRIMWEVDHIKQHNGTVLCAFTKIGTYAVAPPEEIFIMVSPNLLSEQDPTKVVWSIWPSGDRGIQGVGGTRSTPDGVTEVRVLDPCPLDCLAFGRSLTLFLL